MDGVGKGHRPLSNKLPKQADERKSIVSLGKSRKHELDPGSIEFATVDNRELPLLGT